MKNWLIVSASVLAISFTLSARAADGPIPGLPWIHQGTVVTYHFYAAKLYDRNVTFSLNAGGDWVGSDGKTYTADIHKAMDAGGFAETTVLAIDGDNVVLKTTSFLQIGMGDPTRSSPDKGGEPRFVAKARQNTFCEAPDLLAREASDTARGILVRPVVWPVGDKKVDAIRIDKTTKNETMTIIIDRQSGLGIHVASVSSSGADTGTTLMEYDLVGCRDPQIPWVNEPIPQAMKNLKSMRLSGQVTQEARFGLAPSGLAVDLTQTSAGDNWMAFKTLGTAIVPGLPNPQVGLPELRYYGPGEIGGLWIGPDAAGKLREGQVLDEDPFSKTKAIVSQVDNAHITITQGNNSSAQKYVYDRATGILVGSEWFDGVSKFHTTLRKEN